MVHKSPFALSSEAYRRLRSLRYARWATQGERLVGIAKNQGWLRAEQLHFFSCFWWTIFLESGLFVKHAAGTALIPLDRILRPQATHIGHIVGEVESGRFIKAAIGALGGAQVLVAGHHQFH